MTHTPADENPHQGYHSMLLSACEEYRAKVDKLEAENLAMRNEIAWLKSQTMWVCACGGTDCAGHKENAALREALATAEVGLKHALMMEPGDPFKRIKAITAALDVVRAARKETQPIRVDHSGDINEMIQKAKEAQP